MKKLALASVAAAAAFVWLMVLGLPAAAQGPGQLTAGVSATDPVNGSSGIMHIYVHNARALGSWTIDVRYDPGVIEVRQCAPTLQVSTCSFGGGTIRTLGDTDRGASGDLTLARLFFDCVPGAAATALDLTVVGLNDASFHEPFDNVATVDDSVDCGGTGNGTGNAIGGSGPPGQGGSNGGGNGSDADLPGAGSGAIPAGLPATGATDAASSGLPMVLAALVVAAGLSALSLAYASARLD